MTEPPVRLDVTALRMTPSVMRLLSHTTGRSVEQLLQSEESADKFQAMAFIELHRRHPDWSGDELWAAAADTEVILSPEPPDFTGNGQPTTVPPSAVTGG